MSEPQINQISLMTQMFILVEVVNLKTQSLDSKGSTFERFVHGQDGLY